MDFTFVLNIQCFNMKKIIPIALLVIATFWLACSAPTPETTSQQSNTMEPSNKEKVIALLESIETGDTAPIAYINPDKYIQHNLSAADGLQGFGELLKNLPPNSTKVKVVRAFEDGDYVFTHSKYEFFGPKVGFDVFRFENGLIVEHWDNLQERPESANPSGRTMLDGPTTVTDEANTAANKALAEKFVNTILVEGKMDQLAGFFNGDNYMQHNPGVPDQLSGLGAALEQMAKQGIVMKYDKVHRVLGQGNFVLVMSEGTLGGVHKAFYDLFRMEQGKVAEHWDTIETKIGRASCRERV